MESEKNGKWRCRKNWRKQRLHGRANFKTLQPEPKGIDNLYIFKCQQLTQKIARRQSMTKEYQNFKTDQLAQEPLISRLLLYGVIKSQNLTMDDIIENKIEVGVLQHYVNGEIVVNEGDNEFYQMWAYPDGIKIYDNRLKIINDPKPEESFGPQHKISVYSSEIIQGHVTQRPNDFIYSFVHTDYGLNRTYFTALCWHEKKYCPLNKEKLNLMQNKNIYAQRLPKCTLWELQNDPLMIDFNKQLIYVPKVIIVSSKYPIFVFQRQILKFYYRNVLVETSDLLISEEKYNNFKDLIHLVGYPDAQRYFDYEQSNKITSNSKKIKHKQIKKDNLKQFYTSFFFLPKLFKNVNTIQIIDCWNSSIKFTPMLYNKNVCFYKPNINILSILKKIGLQNLIKLWKCIILQRHILIFSMNNLNIIQLCQAMFYLIQPIRWENIYIPFLPFHLVNNIDAIQGFLIGMSRIHMDYIFQHYPMNQKVIFDLDQNVLIENGGKNQVQLPTQIYNMLSNRLITLGFKKKQNVFAYLFKDYNEQVPQTEQQKIFRIKQVFFDALLYLLNNYRIFAKLNDCELLQFDKKSYISMFSDEKWAMFASELVNTMVFIRLCQYHLYQQKILKWNQENIGGLFVYCQNMLAQTYKQEKFWAVPKTQKNTDKIDTSYKKYFNYVMENDLRKLKQDKKVYKIQHYLIKYLNYVQFHRQYNNFQDQQRPQESSFKKMVIQFLFPWVKEIQQQWITQSNKINNRNSLRLSNQCLPNLQLLFGQMKRQGSSPLNKLKIQSLLKEHKGKKTKYIDYRQIKKSLSKQERVSV